MSLPLRFVQVAMFLELQKNSSSRISGEVPDTNFKLGQRVLHEAFGEGVILNYEGEGANARVEVNFDTSKTKWLMVAYAKLQNI